MQGEGERAGRGRERESARKHTHAPRALAVRHRPVPGLQQEHEAQLPRAEGRQRLPAPRPRGKARARGGGARRGRSEGSSAQRHGGRPSRWPKQGCRGMWAAPARRRRATGAAPARREEGGAPPAGFAVARLETFSHSYPPATFSGAVGGCAVLSSLCVAPRWPGAERRGAERVPDPSSQAPPPWPRLPSKPLAQHTPPPNPRRTGWSRSSSATWTS